jgi:hypothetical protein
MSKYTPGPWTIRESATHITVVGANNETIFHDDKRCPSVPEDARLVAAAPELLEALQRVKETGVFVGAIAQEMIDAAIAKAVGEKS